MYTSARARARDCTHTHAYTHTHTYTHTYEKHTTRTVAVTLEEKEQPAVRMIRSKRTYLLTNTQPQRYASCIRDS